MPFPPVDALYEHLCALRDADDPTHPRHDRRWREVAAWLEHAFPGQTPQAQDVRQEALASIVRHVRTLRAETALQAASWIATIVRRKRVDFVRDRGRDPVARGLEQESVRSPGAELDRLEAPPEAPDDRAALERLVATVLDHVHRAVEETEKSASKRQLRRTQAQATLLRVVLGESAEAIARTLDHGEPLGRDVLYKWIERGRPVVRLGLDRWERTADEEEMREVGAAIAALRELVDQRRADAGVPRPDRRTRSEEAP